MANIYSPPIAMRAESRMVKTNNRFTNMLLLLGSYPLTLPHKVVYERKVTVEFSVAEL